MAEVFEIDPDPDTVIILRNIVGNFAPWEEREEAIDDDLSISSPPPLSTREISLDDDGTAPAIQELSMIPHADTLEPKAVDVGDTSSTQDDHETIEVHYHVSSRHLILASPQFKNMLSGKWDESIKNESDDHFHISAASWDVEAFRIVMNVIHGRNRAVPRVVDLKMLAKIAVIVDYYRCLEPMEIFTNIWISDLRDKSQLPTAYDNNLIMWICIAWVFQQQDIFAISTRVAIEQLDEPIPTLELPIPFTVTGSCSLLLHLYSILREPEKIDSERYKAIENVISMVCLQVKDFRSTDYSCSSACASMMLGTLIKGLDFFEFLDPRPEVPFHGLKFVDICTKLNELETPRWSRWNERNSHSCYLSIKLRPAVKDIRSAVTGLRLDDFAGDGGQSIA